LTEGRRVPLAFSHIGLIIAAYEIDKAKGDA
jgi:hypothetical protein